MANRNVVRVDIVGDASSSNRAFDSATKHAEDFGGKTKRTLRDAATVALGVYGPKAIAAVGNFFKSGIQGAMEDERSHALLHRTLDKVAHATGAQKDQVDKWVTSTQNATGVLDDELRPALDTMLRAGNSVADAQKNVTLAMDIATQTGKPLATVTQALAKASNGQETALKKLDPTLNQLIKSGADADSMFAALHQTFDGATETFASTGEGRMKVLQANLTDVKENIGAALLPILGKLATFATSVLVPALEKVTDFMDKHKVAATALAAIIGTLVAIMAVQKVGTVALTAAQGVAKAATVAWSIAQWALNVAMNANPIGLIVIAIAALVAGVVFAYKRFGWFRDLLSGIWKWMRETWGTIGTLLSTAFSGLFDVITLPWRTAFNWIARAWNNTVGKLSFSIPSWVPGVGGKGFDVPDIPTLHTGGIFNSGRGEGLAWLEDGEGVFTRGQMAAMGGAGGDFIVNMPAGVRGADVVREMRKYNRRRGRPS